MLPTSWRCWLMARPDLLLLDEPSGLGLASSSRISEDDHRIRRERRLTIPLIEQRVVEALELCDRGYALETRRVVLGGGREELLADTRVQRARTEAVTVSQPGRTPRRQPAHLRSEPRLCPPAAMTTNCLPLRVPYVIGVACALAGNSALHIIFPVSVSNARSTASRAAPMNTRPPAVARRASKSSRSPTPAPGDPR